MQRCLVTGAAGFIGSHLCERLLEQGCRVIGLDNFSPFYSPQEKRANIASPMAEESFRLVEADLRTLPMGELRGLCDQCDWVFHQAAQAGVRTSWGEDFRGYVENNVLATQRLLEACSGLAPQKVVIASSSSVYGNPLRFPSREDDPCLPVSPYGVTKLSCEHLAGVYHQMHGTPVVTLRYFTVYGPRQRPDMAFRRFFRALQAGEEITLFGDGSQSRDFTYISDAVEANLLAAAQGKPGGIYNIGGGCVVSLHEVIRLMAQIARVEPRLRQMSIAAGDVRRTEADLRRARGELGYRPRIPLPEGLESQYRWMVEHQGGRDPSPRGT